MIDLLNNPIIKPKATDMKLRDAYPSKYLASEDLGDNEVTVKIKAVRMEPLRDRNTGEMVDKPILYFFNKEKGMVLNPTNWKRLELAFGTDETDEYIGKTVVVYVDATPMGPGLHIRGVPVKAKPSASAPRAGKPKEKYNPHVEHPHPMDASENPAEGMPENMEEILDDDIPF